MAYGAKHIGDQC
uniref:Uncharacterized protein n=1 Tax=Anguilla anguilla TaxID=7936 RepID=A0A0E9UN85_ANGAN